MRTTLGGKYAYRCLLFQLVQKNLEMAQELREMSFNLMLVEPPSLSHSALLG